MNIIMDNVRRGITHQTLLAEDASNEGDGELAAEHWGAVLLLEAIYSDYIPCLDSEL